MDGFSPVSLYNLELMDKTQLVVWASSVVHRGTTTHERQLIPPLIKEATNAEARGAQLYPL